MVRFAHNSYGAVRYLCADTPEDPNRKPNYVLVVPNINRQLLDLLFSLVYMLDDLYPRSLEYQRAGWRELDDEYKQYHQRFSKDPAYRPLRIGEENPGGDSGQVQHHSGRAEGFEARSVLAAPTQLQDKRTKSRKYLDILSSGYMETPLRRRISVLGE